MNAKLKSLLLFFFVVQTLLVCAARPQQTYLFGIAYSLNDSTAYVTDIQELNGEQLQKSTGFLIDRAAFGYQLKNHLVKEGTPPLTPVIFFDKTRKAAEKSYAKVIKKMRRQAQKIIYLETGSFQFTPAVVY